MVPEQSRSVIRNKSGFVRCLRRIISTLVHWGKGRSIVQGQIQSAGSNSEHGPGVGGGGNCSPWNPRYISRTNLKCAHVDRSPCKYLPTTPRCDVLNQIRHSNISEQSYIAPIPFWNIREKLNIVNSPQRISRSMNAIERPR
jgi:hypothetical protein